jgi:hypothetical protein
LAKLEFITVDLYLSTRNRDLDWNGHTWQGNSVFRPPRSVRNSKDNTSNGIAIPLVGYDQTIMSLVLEDINQSKKCEIYFGMLDVSDNLITDPYPLFVGRFDTATVQSSGGQREIVLVYENDFMVMTRVNAFRYTDQSQQALFPGDTGFERVRLAADWKGFWGSQSKPLANQKKKRNSTK